MPVSLESAGHLVGIGHEGGAGFLGRIEISDAFIDPCFSRV